MDVCIIYARTYILVRVYASRDEYTKLYEWLYADTNNYSWRNNRVKSEERENATRLKIRENNIISTTIIYRQFDAD